MRDADPLLLTLPDALVRLVLPDEAELLRVELLVVLRTVLPEVLRLGLLDEAELLRLVVVLEEAGVVVVAPVLRLTVVVPEGVDVLIRVSAEPDVLTRLLTVVLDLGVV